MCSLCTNPKSFFLTALFLEDCFYHTITRIQWNAVSHQKKKIGWHFIVITAWILWLMQFIKLMTMTNYVSRDRYLVIIFSPSYHSKPFSFSQSVQKTWNLAHKSCMDTFMALLCKHWKRVNIFLLLWKLSMLNKCTLVV